jgi:hypothetical protein
MFFTIALVFFAAAFACFLLWVVPIPQHNVGIVHAGSHF